MYLVKLLFKIMTKERILLLREQMIISRVEEGDERRDRTSTEDMKIGGALTVAIAANDCKKEGGEE